MNLKDLNDQYPNGELSRGEGDPVLRYKVLSPVLLNLYQNKIIYHENITSIIRVQNLVLSPEMFEATARHHLSISRGRMAGHYPIPETWSFSASWKYLHISGNRLTTGYNWNIWTDPELVKKVEELVLEEKYDEAMKMTYYD